VTATRDRPPEFIDDDNTLLWPMQLIAYLLIIVGILINVGLIRARNARRSDSPMPDLVSKYPNPGWSLDLANTNMGQKR